MGQCGTNKGFFDMARFCETKGEECRMFFTAGMSHKPQVFRRELQAILGLHKPPADVAVTIRDLIALLKPIKTGYISATNG